MNLSRSKNALSALVVVAVSTASSAHHLLWSSSAVAAEGVGKIRPLITTAELVPGANRFAFGLMKANRLLDNADVIVRLFQLKDGQGHLVAQAAADYKPIAGANENDKVHRHSDGTPHTHTSDWDVKGLYVARLAFPTSGIWGVELLVREPSLPPETVRLSVGVLDRARTPTVGAPAPRSRNLTAADVPDLREIDTSPRPDPRLHQVRIAEAIAKGRPQLIVFATPQFCTSRMCGPVVDIVRGLLPAYEKRVDFSHQEIWQDFAAKKLFPTVKEWGLYTEPWIFVVDGKGIIRAKFEGLVTKDELEQALQEIIPPHS